MAHRVLYCKLDDVPFNIITVKSMQLNPNPTSVQ